jgi:ribosomal protein L40E
MGFLLKIALFGLALYGVYRSFRYWKGLFDRFTGNDLPQRPPPPPPPPAPARPEPPPAAPARKPVVIEDTVQCAGCGAYIPATAEKCGQCGRPRP